MLSFLPARTPPLQFFWISGFHWFLQFLSKPQTVRFRSGWFGMALGLSDTPWVSLDDEVSLLSVSNVCCEEVGTCVLARRACPASLTEACQPRFAGTGAERMLDLVLDFAVRERVRRFFFFILIDARLRSLFRIFFSALLNQRLVGISGSNAN